MGKYYCDYCDTFLTHDSPSVRKTHNNGRKHKENVRYYYQKWVEEQAQTLIDQRGVAIPPPVGNMPSGGAGGMPGAMPGGMPMMRPGMPMMPPPPMGMMRPGMPPPMGMSGPPGPGMPPPQGMMSRPPMSR
ncbi:U1 small nuclear ribonucleoprotein C-like [Sycon ciliatum]|uniref:U1 small nuclear ribonucleoprotein C-like n=1 Tax=Sycon ciliatum TaxID=27933 RepID=UPI0020ADA639